jgi:transposase
MTANRKRRPHRTRAEWIEEIRRWRRSGQTAADYGAKYGVHPKTLVLWASKLRDVVPLAERGGGGRAVRHFVPVRVTPAERPVVSAAAPEFEVLLRNGRRVRVSGDFQPDVLARLLAAADGGAAC